MSGGERLNVEIQPDIIDRLTKARPLPALAELIWNSLDADADRVTVTQTRDALKTLVEITITDDGDGLPRTDALAQFKRYGGSWKQPGGLTRRKKRALHGFEGRGRFNALALGRAADWHVVYEVVPGGERRGYKISMLASDNRAALVGPESATEEPTGVRLVILEPHRQYTALNAENAVPALLEIFALYLIDYRGVRITVDGEPVDATDAVRDRISEPLDAVTTPDGIYPVELEIVEWKRLANRSLQLCTENGIPLLPAVTRFHVAGDYSFSAYLKSPLVTKLHEKRALDFAVNAELSEAIDQARGAIRAASQRRAAEAARSIVTRWKDEKVYPFETEATTDLERAEQQLFDMVAVTASAQIAGFEQSGPRNKALQLRLMRAALGKAPEQLQFILTEVLRLPVKLQEKLAELLKESSLPAIIGAASEVAERLKTLSGLEGIIFDTDAKRRLKERAQLHKILNENTWLFGDEYRLSASDSSLTTVLREHKKLLGDDVVIDEPVRHINQQRGIVDLMFSRVLQSHRPKETEHLVVELKAPRVRLTAKETGQIRGYAFSVAADERFRDAKTRWAFWLVASEMDKHVTNETRQASLPRGMLYQSTDPDITIWVKTWSEIFDENKAKLKFFKDQMQHAVDQREAIQFVGDKYRHFLEGVLAEVEATEVAAADVAASVSDASKPMHAV